MDDRAKVSVLSETGFGYITMTARASSGLSGRLAYWVGPDRFASLFAVEDSWEKYEGAAVKEQRNNQCEVALIHEISRCKFPSAETHETVRQPGEFPYWPNACWPRPVQLRKW